MGIKAYVRGTAEWHERRLQKSFPALAAKGDILCYIEYPDGVATLEPANWDVEQEKYVTVRSDLEILVRGEGSNPKSLWGVPVLKVYAPNAAAISTEAAITADRLEHGDYVDVDENGEPIEPVGPADNGDRVAVADGGTTEVADRVFSLIPPDGSQAQAFSLKEASDYDPNPVTEQDLKRAVEFTEIGDNQMNNRLRDGLIGAGAATGLILGIIFFFWLLGQIGGGEGTTIGIGAVAWYGIAAILPAMPGGFDAD